MEKWVLNWSRLLPLDHSSLNDLPDNLIGVYRLSYQAKDGKKYIFYVGKSDHSIKDRILGHLSDEETNVCIKNYLKSKTCFFKYSIISRDYIRSSAERQAYRHYQPSCNEREPEGRDDIEVNLN